MTHSLLLIATAILATVTACRAELSVGDVRDTVIEQLGEPEARVKERGRETFYYGRSQVVLAHGVVADFDRDVEKEASRIRTQRRSPSAPVSPPPGIQPRAARKVRPAIPTVQLGKPKKAKTGQGKADAGASIDLQRVLVAGKVTVLDFYADWCGPCRKVAPHLEALARDDKEVRLHKVDIVRWGTDVTKQFSIRSIPHIRVYDRSGKMVGQPTSNLAKVRQYVQQAK